jgi:hypothetical protein
MPIPNTAAINKVMASRCGKQVLYKRLQHISQGSDHLAERLAIEDAVAGLRILKRDKLGFPDWEKK